jgi:hypothetical protein
MILNNGINKKIAQIVVNNWNSGFYFINKIIVIFIIEKKTILIIEIVIFKVKIVLL